MKPNLRILGVYGFLAGVMVALTVFETWRDHLVDPAAFRPGTFRAPKIWSQLVLEDDKAYETQAGIGGDTGSGDNVDLRNGSGGGVSGGRHSGGEAVGMSGGHSGDGFLNTGGRGGDSGENEVRDDRRTVDGGNNSDHEGSSHWRAGGGPGYPSNAVSQTGTDNEGGSTVGGSVSGGGSSKSISNSHSGSTNDNDNISSDNLSNRSQTVDGSQSDTRKSVGSSVGSDSWSPPLADRMAPPEFVEDMPAEFKKPEEGLDMYHPPLKKILVWSEGYGSKTMSFGYGRAPFVKAGCEVDTCLMTANRSLVPFEQFDALVFHFRAMEPKALPKYRYPHQHWVFWEMESSSYVYQDPGRYNGLFNLTMSYRRDSDVLSTYGRVYRVPSASPVSSGGASGAGAGMTGKDYAEGKTRLAAWFVSNCYTHSRREKLVAAMQKFIKVDIYGHCGPQICPRSTTHQCYTMVARRYKFYLSFENSLCRDYVTEKFFSILRYDVVPVVLGLADYGSLAPPHSYINALDFSSVEHLVKYLTYLDKNHTAYNQYFRWKEHYQVHNGWSNTARGFCDLCRRLHQDEGRHQSYPDLMGWFVKKGGCKKLDTSAWSRWLW